MTALCRTASRNGRLFKNKRVVIFSDRSRLSGFDPGEVHRPLRVNHTWLAMLTARFTLLSALRTGRMESTWKARYFVTKKKIKRARKMLNEREFGWRTVILDNFGDGCQVVTRRVSASYSCTALFVVRVPRCQLPDICLDSANFCTTLALWVRNLNHIKSKFENHISLLVKHLNMEGKIEHYLFVL